MVRPRKSAGGGVTDPDIVVVRDAHLSGNSLNVERPFGCRRVDQRQFQIHFNISQPDSIAKPYLFVFVFQVNHAIRLVYRF